MFLALHSILFRKTKTKMKTKTKKMKIMSQLTVMRMILVAVFVGWLLLWVLLPTKIYKQSWTPKLNHNLNSTYFLEQGTNLLLFTFPIMFLAALGCIYLHQLQKKPEQSAKTKSTSRRWFWWWKRPVLVMGPLGIVNAVELAFAAMFVALSVWSLANYLYISFGNLMMHGDKIWQAKFRSVSLRLGYVGNISWAFLFFPVTRGSSLLPLVGLTSESSIKYHIWLGHLSMLLFAAHSIGFFIYWGMTNQMVDALEWSKTYVSNVAGEIAFVIAMVMWVACAPQFRRKMFEFFFYTHNLYPLYILFYLLHVGSAYTCMILPGIFLFLIDRHLRFLQSQKRATLISARLLPCQALELNFSKAPGLHYNPTSILFINVPAISKLQWHPFTVTSNSNMEVDNLSIVVKTLQGSWTDKLYQHISSSKGHLEVAVEGPYGPASSTFLRHEKLVLVSGGSGITPFISIIREMMIQSTKPNDPHNHNIPQSVLLVCAFKNSSDLSMLHLLLPISCTTNPSQIQLQIEAYITQETEDHQQTIRATDSSSQKLVQTIWFKTNPSLASPISATLGPNNWLCLCAIIVSSFLMFLLLLGIVTRYYIFPIDRASSAGSMYHYSYRVMWDLFLACGCVFVVSSGVFLWCKKRYASEGKQIQNVDVATPTTMSPERELESLPHQSLIQATNVHFGARPDLKRILFECKGSDVGVLVCGPRKMRHEVAKICSSGLADNLNFESISFNW